MIRGIEKAVRARRVSRRKKRNKTVVISQRESADNRRWASKSLETFADALRAFRTAMSFRFFNWLTQNMDVFAAHKADFGFIWA
jgi:hypothetical protein